MKSKCFVLLVVIFPAVVHAYIGPGLGTGAIAAAIGVVGAILIGLFAVIYYPLKRIFKSCKKSAGKPANPVASNRKRSHFK